MSFLADPAVHLTIASAIALLFLSAALAKLRALAPFAATVAAYHLLPERLSVISAPLLPLFELAVGGALLMSGARPAAALMGSALLLLYALAIGINLIRGRRDLDCGCMGPGQRRPITPFMIWRNVALAAVLLILLLPEAPRRLGLLDASTVLFALAGVSCLYLALDRLLGDLAPRARTPGLSA
jgi:hypothetical protein